jgi:hypothetical protein
MGIDELLESAESDLRGRRVNAKSRDEAIAAALAAVDEERKGIKSGTAMTTVIGRLTATFANALRAGLLP